KAPFVELIKGFDHAYDFIGNDGPVFYFKTDHDAPRGKIVAIDTHAPEGRKVLVPEAPEAIESVTFVDDQFVVSYLKDAHALVKLFDRSGKLVRTLELKGCGTASGF